jgi:UTP--glucose-1-phosphate uridylyltransferase
MQIRKAVITSAARSQRALPLQTLVDRDGVSKSALQIIIEEAASAGVSDIGLVIAPGDQAAYTAAAGSKAEMLTFIEQREPLGYGHALWCARDFTGSEPFLHLVSDHLYIARSEKRCAQQLVEVAKAEDCCVSAVQATRENVLPFYGTVGGHRVRGSTANLYEVETVVEKPTPTEAEQTLIVPGLRAGHYLCFFGIHVLTPAVMEILSEHVAAAAGKDPVQLSPALAKLAARERYLAMEVSGQRHNIGVKYGLLIGQLALALDGHDREQIMTDLLELLAGREARRQELKT